MKATLYQHDLIVCPWCGAQSGKQVDHLYRHKLPQRFGPWYCEECQQAFSGEVIAPGDITVEKTPEMAKKRSYLVLLRRDQSELFFVMKHDQYVEHDGPNLGFARYFFEEHSCPVNWLSDCIAVIDAGDTDPHGFLRFVDVVEIPADFDPDDSDQWSKIFPEAFLEKQRNT